VADNGSTQEGGTKRNGTAREPTRAFWGHFMFWAQSLGSGDGAVGKTIEHNIFILALIVDGATEKASQFIMTLKLMLFCLATALAKISCAANFLMRVRLRRQGLGIACNY
jgi:hypothetical protein